MNIFSREFSTGEVVAATGVSNSTLQSWLKRDVIIGHKNAPISGAGSPGAHRRYSFYNVMEIATAKALLDIGLSDLRDAFQAAAHFAHVGDGGIAGHSPPREPSLPYPPSAGAYTLIYTVGKSTRVAPWVPGKDPVAGIFSEMNAQGTHGVVLLFANPLFDRVCAALQYHPQEVVEAAYGTRGAN